MPSRPRRLLRAAALLLALRALAPSPGEARAAALAATPPMGWATWNAYGCRIDEALVRANADALVASGMRDAGYRYVLVDDCWQAPTRDAGGRLRADPRTFPHGIKALADYLHARGLKLALYTSVGRVTCEGRPASLDHEALDARTFAAWGVDYVKDDLCGGAPLFRWWPFWDFRPHYERMSRALRAASAEARRPILFSLCTWGFGAPWTWGGGVAQLWRTSFDIRPDWRSVMSNLDSVLGKERYAGPGRWNDPDILEVGVGALTPGESLAHFAMWAMAAAPLMAGNELIAMPAKVRDILTAPEIIAVDQDPAGRPGALVSSSAGGDLQVWARALADRREVAVALLNRGGREADIAARWTDLGLNAGAARVRDLWRRRDLGEFSGSFSARVPGHGVVILKVRQ